MKASERHKLKHDKYADTVAKSIEWAREHRTRLLVGIAVVLFACAVATWLTLSRQSAEQAAGDLLSEVRNKAYIVSFLLEKTDEKTITEVVASCDQIATDYPRTQAAPLALLRAGQVLNQTGRPDEAVSFFVRALELADNRPGTAALGRRGLAEALEQSGKLKEAIANYQMLIASDGSPTDAQVRWDIARCYERLGETDKARGLYGKILTDTPDTLWAELARFRIERAASPSAPEASKPPLSPTPTPDPSPTDPAAAE